MSLLWPLIVDGLAVAATRGVLTLQRRAYAWLLLAGSTTISIVAAFASSMLSPGPLPSLAAAVGCR